MAIDRDQFFAELDALTDQEIEARLPLWDRERLVLVQEYIDGGRPEPSQVSEPAVPPGKRSEVDRDARDAALVALTSAKKASVIAMSALILSVGAMLTAIAAGIVVYTILLD